MSHFTPEGSGNSSDVQIITSSDLSQDEVEAMVGQTAPVTQEAALAALERDVLAQKGSVFATLAVFDITSSNLSQDCVGELVEKRRRDQESLDAVLGQYRGARYEDRDGRGAFAEPFRQR